MQVARQPRIRNGFRSRVGAPLHVPGSRPCPKRPGSAGSTLGSTGHGFPAHRLVVPMRGCTCTRGESRERERHGGGAGERHGMGRCEHRTSGQTRWKGRRCFSTITLACSMSHGMPCGKRVRSWVSLPSLVPAHHANTCTRADHDAAGRPGTDARALRILPPLTACRGIAVPMTTHRAPLALTETRPGTRTQAHARTHGGHARNATHGSLRSNSHLR